MFLYNWFSLLNYYIVISGLFQNLFADIFSSNRSRILGKDYKNTLICGIEFEFIPAMKKRDIFILLLGLFLTHKIVRKILSKI